MKKITVATVSAVIALPILLWLGGQGFGYGPGFQKPPVPLGSKIRGPGATGMITYIVSPPGGIVQPWATVEFHGQCTVGHGGKAVTYPLDTPKFDFTQQTQDYDHFAAATAQAIADAVDSFFTDDPVAAGLAQNCWPGAFGVFVQNISGAGTKVPVGTPPTAIYTWTGDATLKGVFH
jgi:hypothetical protein